jgi:hypothetical protein
VRLFECINVCLAVRLCVTLCALWNNGSVSVYSRHFPGNILPHPVYDSQVCFQMFKYNGRAHSIEVEQFVVYLMELHNIRRSKGQAKLMSRWFLAKHQHELLTWFRVQCAPNVHENIWCDYARVRAIVNNKGWDVRYEERDLQALSTLKYCRPNRTMSRYVSGW